ncbi:MAG: hypothetical protein ACC645_06270, partial [Pirellulales bacterium]
QRGARSGLRFVCSYVPTSSLLGKPAVPPEASQQCHPGDPSKNDKKCVPAPTDGGGRPCPTVAPQGEL